MKTLKIILLIFILPFYFLSYAQVDTLEVINPSFEDTPRPQHTPFGWWDCGFNGETPPDVHSDTLSFFGVKKKAFHGNTYLGMVVRANDTWESACQRLSKPLMSCQKYTFSIYLCTSKVYISYLRDTNIDIDFTDPIKLRIWGGNGYCDKSELFAESPLITNNDWKKFDFEFNPSDEYQYIVLEVYFNTPTIEVPNGNILLDNCSKIIPIN